MYTFVYVLVKWYVIKYFCSQRLIREKLLEHNSILYLFVNFLLWVICFIVDNIRFYVILVNFWYMIDIIEQFLYINFILYLVYVFRGDHRSDMWVIAVLRYYFIYLTKWASCNMLYDFIFVYIQVTVFIFYYNSIYVCVKMHFGDGANIVIIIFHLT